MLRLFLCAKVTIKIVTSVARGPIFWFTSCRRPFFPMFAHTAGKWGGED